MLAHKIALDPSQARMIKKGCKPYRSTTGPEPAASIKQEKK